MISGYVITILIPVAIYAILAHSLNIITGHAGQISLGHAAFFGIGAYTSALLYTEAGLSFWLSVPLAAVAAGIIGAVLGIPCLRVRDDFLAITTWGSISWWRPSSSTFPSSAGPWESRESISPIGSGGR